MYIEREREKERERVKKCEDGQLLKKIKNLIKTFQSETFSYLQLLNKKEL